MSTDIKIGKTQLYKIIQLGGFLDALLGKVAGPLMMFAVPLAKHLQPQLAPWHLLVQ